MVVLFFCTVLLGLPESEGGKFMGAMVLASLLFYPLVNFGSAKIGKKPFVLLAFGVLCLIFVTIFFLGKLPFGPYTQIYIPGFIGLISFGCAGYFTYGHTGRYCPKRYFRNGRKPRGYVLCS